MKKISIIIPTLNSSKTIARCLNSVMRQTYKNWEIIIVDSYSNDKTVEIIKNYKTKKIKIIYLSRAKSMSEARYRGICNSDGDYIAFLDSDDEWMIKKLEMQIHKMGNNLDFSCTYFTLKNESKSLKVKTKKNYLTVNDLIYDRPIALSSVIVKKNIIKKTIKKNLKLDYAEDFFWWTDIMRSKKKCLVIKKFLTKIYIHENNRSINLIKNYVSLLTIYRKNFLFSYIKIFSIFVMLMINTFYKNIFKLTKFKKKLV